MKCELSVCVRARRVSEREMMFQQATTPPPTTTTTTTTHTNPLLPPSWTACGLDSDSPLLLPPKSKHLQALLPQSTSLAEAGLSCDITMTSPTRRRPSSRGEVGRRGNRYKHDENIKTFEESKIQKPSGLCGLLWKTLDFCCSYFSSSSLNSEGDLTDTNTSTCSVFSVRRSYPNNNNSTKILQYKSKKNPKRNPPRSECQMENSLAENKRSGSELLVKRLSFYFPAALVLGTGHSPFLLV